MLPEGLTVGSRTSSVVGDMRSLQLAHFGLLFLCLDSFCANELHHTQHIFVFLVQFGALCSHLNCCLIEGVVLNSLTLKIMPVY